VDLVREQLLVAQGLPMSVRQDGLAITGHAIEARLYAEDPAAGFLPATGTLLDWHPTLDPAVRWDSGVETGSEVGVEFDPLLAKVIAHAPTRQEAALRLARALARSRIRGVTTNRDFLVAALRHDAFLAGDTTTAFIERVGVALAREPSAEELRVAGIAAALSAQTEARAGAVVLQTLPSGWRNSIMPPQRREYEHGTAGSVEVTYQGQRDGTFLFGDEGVRLGGVDRSWVEFERGDRRHRVHVFRSGLRVWVQGPDGDVALAVRPRFPEAGGDAGVAGGLLAPMPGKVLAVVVGAGDEVVAGQLLMIVEAMKMEHRITAPHAGIVGEVRAQAGDQVAGGDLLVVLRDGTDPAGNGAAGA
jgi:propionyl-CoA carboxylase alpha chain